LGAVHRAGRKPIAISRRFQRSAGIDPPGLLQPAARTRQLDAEAMILGASHYCGVSTINPLDQENHVNVIKATMRVHFIIAALLTLTATNASAVTQYIRVNYPSTRTVYIDGTATGSTGVVLMLEAGTHTIDLGDPVDYSPTYMQVVLQGTTPADPTEFTFSTLSGGNQEDPFNRDCNPEPCSPLVLDLNGDGVHTTSAADPVLFDIDADGVDDRIGWTNPRTEEGFLWIDLNGDHVVNNGSELFGIASRLPDGTLAPDGFAALAAYDQPRNGGNGDGKITVADHVWSRLRLWVDADHDGNSSRAEVGPVQQYHIVALNLAYVTDTTPDPSGNFHWLRGTYLRRVVGDGPAEIRRFALDDVFFAAQP
jgi:hypothetical protein